MLPLNRRRPVRNDCWRARFTCGNRKENAALVTARMILARLIFARRILAGAALLRNSACGTSFGAARASGASIGRFSGDETQRDDAGLRYPSRNQRQVRDPCGADRPEAKRQSADRRFRRKDDCRARQVERRTERHRRPTWQADRAATARCAPSWNDRTIADDK